MSQSSLLPTVTLIGGTLRVSSLEIAEKFGKRHERVLDAIRRIAAELPEDFREHNFVSTFVDVSCPKGAVRKSPAYSLTRDAFSLVVMGFTGKTALAWKVRYIGAFNAMEAELVKQATGRTKKALPKAEQQALPPADPFDVLLDNIEIVRLRTKEDVSKLYHEAVRLADKRLLGMNIWCELWAPLYDWIEKAIVASVSTKDPHGYAAGTPIGLLKAVSQRLERIERQEMRRP